jgi:hypothetical protein
MFGFKAVAPVREVLRERHHLECSPQSRVTNWSLRLWSSLNDLPAFQTHGDHAGSGSRYGLPRWANGLT